MKTRAPIAPPKVLDLDTLGRVIGGAGRMLTPSDPSLAIASADAWHSLSFDRAQLATDFMRSHFDDKSSEGARQSAWSPVQGLRAEVSVLDDDKIATPEFHCGTMQVAPVHPSDEQPTMPRATLASTNTDESVR